MGKKVPHTPRSQVRHALRLLWLRSRERTTTLKEAGYCCSQCGRKQTKAKDKELLVEVHHTQEINWEHLIDLVYQELLHPPETLRVLCVPCHDQAHKQ